jgi:HAD superfamily hydrolase (TIGR01549 family)
MAIRGVIFDLGHTLMHLDGTWPEIFERSAADLAAFLDGQNLPASGEAFARALLEHRSQGFVQARETMREVTAEESMRWTFAQFGLPDPDPELLSGAIDTFFAYEEAHWFADPEALPLLRRLASQGLRLGMFSNATHDPFIQRLVARFGFRPWLHPALSSAGTGIRKPDPTAFAPILQAWQLPAALVAVVGDRLEADILGAKQAAMRSVWIPARRDARQEGGPSEGAQAVEVITPDGTIGRLSELPGCLAAW